MALSRRIQGTYKLPGCILLVFLCIGSAVNYFLPGHAQEATSFWKRDQAGTENVTKIASNQSLSLFSAPTNASDIEGPRTPLERKSSCFEADATSMTRLLRKKGPLPKPAINLGMPKVGSTTLFDFFHCSGWKSSHWLTVSQGEIGKCMRNAAEQKKPVLKTCDSWYNSILHKNIPKPNETDDHGAEAYLQMDLATKTGTCIFPQMEYLEEIHEEAPNATFILIFRPMEDWTRSIGNWAFGNLTALSDRLSRCDLPGLPADKGSSSIEMMNWFCWHVNSVRSFVEKYPSHALVELDLYKTETNAMTMAKLFQSNQSCWGHSNTNLALTKRKVTIPTTSDTITTVSSQPGKQPFNGVDNMTAPGLQNKKMIISNYGGRAPSIGETSQPSCFKADILSMSNLMKEKTTLNRPVINLSLPKVGSTSLFNFFNCSGWKSSHWLTISQGEIGKCMRKAADQGKPLLESCDSWYNPMLHKNIPRPNEADDHGAEAYLQLDFAGDDGDCSFPQIQYLKEIHQEAPNATFLLAFLPMQDWGLSLYPKSGLGSPSLGERISRCDNLPGLHHGSQLGNYRGAAMVWWCGHVKKVRSFVKKYPSHALVEVDMKRSPRENAITLGSLFKSDPKCSLISQN